MIKCTYKNFPRLIGKQDHYTLIHLITKRFWNQRWSLQHPSTVTEVSAALESQRAVLLPFHQAARFLGLLHDIIAEGKLKTRRKLFQNRHLILGQRKNWSHIVSSGPSARIGPALSSFEGPESLLTGIISLGSLICVFLVHHKVHFTFEVLPPLLSRFSCKSKLPNGRLLPFSAGFFFFQPSRSLTISWFSWILSPRKMYT